MTAFRSAVFIFALAVVPPMGRAEGVFAVPATHAVIVPGTDLGIILSDVIDQRCPSALDCYWEGMKRVRLDLTDGKNPAVTIILCNLCDDGTDFVDVMGHRLTFLDLLPPVEEVEGLGRQPVLTDYSAALVVDGG